MRETNAGSGDGSDLQRRQASVYDAVAGRVGYEGFLTDEVPSKFRDTTVNSKLAVPPEEVLFRRKGAPLRFEEDDIYTADRYLQPHQRLPDSDLLKTIHAYASDFYSRKSGDYPKHDLKSLDETALLAMGILLEEAAVQSLGKTGDLALVEGAVECAGTLEGPRPSLGSNTAQRRSVLDRTQPVRRSARSRSVKWRSGQRSRTSRSRSTRR